MDLPRLSPVSVLSVVVAAVAACCLRHWWFLWIDPLPLAVVGPAAVFSALRPRREKLFWISFGLAGATYGYTPFWGGVANVVSWCGDLGVGPLLQSMGPGGDVLVNAIDGFLTLLVAVLGGMVGYYLFPASHHVLHTATRHRERLRFSLRTLLTVTVLFGLSFAVSVMFVPLAIACVAASLLGAAVGHILAIEPRKPGVTYPVWFGAIGGAIMSPFQIAFEWSGAGHPWPNSDVLYVLSVFVRCMLLGGIAGFLVWHSLNFRFVRRAGSSG